MAGIQWKKKRSLERVSLAGSRPSRGRISRRQTGHLPSLRACRQSLHSPDRWASGSRYAALPSRPAVSPVADGSRGASALPGGLVKQHSASPYCHGASVTPSSHRGGNGVLQFCTPAVLGGDQQMRPWICEAAGCLLGGIAFGPGLKLSSPDHDGPLAQGASSWTHPRRTVLNQAVALGSSHGSPAE
jgi:hypothetical protein